MIYCFDLDGTICTSVKNSNYAEAKPDIIIVNEINRLYDEGNKIIIMTARGSVSKIDNTEFTTNQLNEWGVKYSELVMNKKPNADFFIDDKGVHIDDWKKSLPVVKGVIAGAFDVIHPGYCRMFKECKLHCSNLTVALHEDPSVERNKIKPIHSLEERKEILHSIKHVDRIIVYKTESDLYNLLKNEMFHIRFLGEDYVSKPYTGEDLGMSIHYITREHEYSTTNMKKKIYQSLAEYQP